MGKKPRKLTTDDLIGFVIGYCLIGPLISIAITYVYSWLK